MSQIKWIISPSQVKEFQQTGKYLQCEYDYQGSRHISFHCQFIDTGQYYNLYDFRNIYDPKWIAGNVCIFSIPKNSSAWAFRLPTHVHELGQYSNAKVIESTNIRNVLSLPPLQTPTMSKLQQLIIDDYLKNKKNVKKIADFSTQLKLKASMLRNRRDEIGNERNEISDQINKIDNLFNDLEEAIEDGNIPAIEEIISNNMTQVLPLK